MHLLITHATFTPHMPHTQRGFYIKWRDPSTFDFCFAHANAHACDITHGRTVLDTSNGTYRCMFADDTDARVARICPDNPDCNSGAKETRLVVVDDAANPPLCKHLCCHTAHAAIITEDAHEGARKYVEYKRKHPTPDRRDNKRPRAGTN